MFNIGLGEMLFIAVLALIALGPERLPKLMRKMGEIARQIRGVVDQFNSQFADELQPIREIQSLTTELNPMRQIGAVVGQASQTQATIAPAAAPAATAQPAFVSIPGPGAGAPHPMTQISQQRLASQPPPAEPPAPSPAAAAPSDAAPS